MKIETIKRRIDSRLEFHYQNNTVWEEHIKALKAFFKTFDSNSTKRFVLPKVVCIDRIYKGSLYRQGYKSYTKEITSFANGVIKNSAEIDRLLMKLKSKRKYDPAYKEECIKVFENTLKGMQNSNRQVLLSKYLHFHAPNFFPILDQFAERKLLSINKVLNLVEDSASLRGLSRYAKFYYMIDALYFKLGGAYPFIELDKYLYGDR